MLIHIWLCLKIVYPKKTHGFADHYPYEMAISLGVYPIFRHTQIGISQKARLQDNRDNY